MTTYDAWDVLLLRFPFTDGSGFKQRPALVILDSGDADILVARVTSQYCSTLYDVSLQDWQASGLMGPSFVRLHKLATLDKSLVGHRLGTLAAADQLAVKSAMSQLLTSLP